MRNMLAVMSIAVAVCAVSWAETGEDLYTAVNEGNRGLVEKILKSGVDVNYSRGNGWRPVNQACLNGDLPMVELLVSKGASLSMTNKGAWFPLLAAVSSGNRDLVEYLCSRPECEYRSTRTRCRWQRRRRREVPRAIAWAALRRAAPATLR